MWTLLGIFTIYRKDIAGKAGEKYGDNEWSFGQVLALMMCVPIFIDLAVF